MGFPFDKGTRSINGQSVTNLSDFATNLSNVGISECLIKFTNKIIERSTWKRFDASCKFNDWTSEVYKENSNIQSFQGK